MRYIRLLWNLYKLKCNTFKTKLQIKNLQDKKLKKMLLYAYKHSAYYKNSFEQAGITEETIQELPLTSFPTINKSIFIKHFDELVTVPNLKQEDLLKFDKETSAEQRTFQNQYHVVHSSGSTGAPAYFIYDTKAWEQMLLGIIRAALWNMTMPQILKLLWKEPRIAYIAATDGRYGGAMAVGDGISEVKAQQLFLDINTPLKEWTKKITEFHPNIVIGYPSAIKILGELAEKKEVEINVIRIISCGEPLGASLRHYIETIFKAEVINIYGASESLALGVEGNQEKGMYLFDDLNYIEVENGVMYLTSLYNFTQPLIRYQISDQLELKNADGNCRYPFTRAENILGRNEDLLWFEDGNGNREFLHPLAIEGFCIEGLVDYQFRQIDKNAFEMLAEVSSEKEKRHIKLELLKQMKQILCEKQLEYVQFYVNFVEKVLPDPNTGKKRLIAA